jgi:fucose 4-O-acetylase-like acetyltransferase
MKKERISWIDWAKTILIFLMVSAHCNIHPYPQQFIHAFHMPAFFLISGYLFRLPLVSLKNR